MELVGMIRKLTIIAANDLFLPRGSTHLPEVSFSPTTVIKTKP